MALLTKLQIITKISRTVPLPSEIGSAVARWLAQIERNFAGWQNRLRLRDRLDGVGWLLASFIASRVTIFATIKLSRMVIVPSQWWHPGGVASVLTQWDGELWYIRIARYGYHIDDGDHFPHGFFPLYPLMIRLVSFIFRDMRVAALVTSNVCLIVAGFFLHLLIRLDYKDPRVSRTALMLFMFSPVSFFFSSSYTESTFFMFAVGALLAARNKQWLVACLCGMCLSASRPPGVLIGIPLFIEYLHQVWTPRPTLRALFHPRILLLGIVPLGLFLYMFYEYIEFHDAFAFSHSAKVFGRSFTTPLQTLSYLDNYNLFYKILFCGTTMVNLVLLLTGWLFRVRWSYLAYAAALLLIYLCSATFEAFPRYVSVEFPLFVILGIIVARYRWSYEPLLACSVGLLTLCTILSANGYWMT